MMRQFENVAAVPRSVEAEQAVLGGLMLVNEQWDNVAEILSEADFSESVHRVIYREMALLVKRNSPIDLITLSDSLRGRGLEQACGGFGYIAEMSKNTPSAANILAYAELVRETAIKREILAVMNEVATETTQPRGRSATELLDLAERKVMGISEIRAKSQSGPSRIDDILGSTLDRLEHLFQTPHDGVTGLDTGYTDLNKKTAGLQNSDLIVIAARPSMGKTTFAMNICENVANNQDKPVLIFSLEMPKDQLMMRVLASLGRVDQTRIRTGMLDDDDWHRISATSSVILERNNIFIDDTSGLTPTELRSRARRLHRECGGLSLIMVDYLQLMRVPELDGNRTLEIAEISRSLKSLAKELQIPVIALSQLNRSLEARSDKRPLNSDLRESGSIEQDADLIIFIYRDEVYNERSEDKGTAEIIIGKQRNGPIGTVRLTFNGKWSRFDNYAGAVSDD
ncbi:replicative DNA helicase [Salmonella enterica]|uniref:replicative DNA helicase n=1 Tax=Enterobacter bugandensis TaxID=881260 RepID=UPI0020197FF5|nr:replicative DNA helicase [Enterobacter bugandensis]EJO6345773.1 replicative DNA helicase [Salmonella enterica]MCE1555362.1 replicative DNA helicase [Enterobacter hormaechei]EKZ2393258.1 replicative DNA helicase [Salmonella enterica]ELT4872566.1 replicative DNA helicase [Salmonella enterica]UQQ28760.1 replicative DNA helicase [Enterobacter bugandensis]